MILQGYFKCFKIINLKIIKKKVIWIFVQYTSRIVYMFINFNI